MQHSGAGRALCLRVCLAAPSCSPPTITSHFEASTATTLDRTRHYPFRDGRELWAPLDFAFVSSSCFLLAISYCSCSCALIHTSQAHITQAAEPQHPRRSRRDPDRSRPRIHHLGLAQTLHAPRRGGHVAFARCLVSFVGLAAPPLASTARLDSAMATFPGRAPSGLRHDPLRSAGGANHTHHPASACRCCSDTFWI